MSHKRKTGIPMYEEKLNYLIKHQGRQYLRMEFGRIPKQLEPELFTYCPIELAVNGIRKKPYTVHHAKVHNTWWNQSCYPLLYNSLLNLMATTQIQTEWSSFGKVSPYIAEKMESFLERHPRAEAFVNRLKPLGYFKGGNKSW